MTGGVLANVRVLDFTWVGAGPLATRFLAEFGADVIKIESIERPDALRSTPPFKSGVPGLERSGYFAGRNANKRSFALNMAHPGAPDIVLKLVAGANICAQSFRPGTMERWGLNPERLWEVRPDLIYLAMPLLGEWGPHSRFSGFGASLTALCGLYSLCGVPERPPVGTGTNYPDHVPNPMHAVAAMLAGLRSQMRGGPGVRVEVSQLESTLNVMGSALLEAQGPNQPYRQGNAIGYGAPHGVYPTSEQDGWVAISVMTESQWKELREVVGIEPAVDGRPLASVGARHRAREYIDLRIRAWTEVRTQSQAMDELQAAGVPAGAVVNASEVLSDAHLQQRDAFRRLPHAELGDSIYSNTVPKLSRTPGELTFAAPLLGEHTEEIAIELLGMTAAEVREHREGGLFR